MCKDWAVNQGKIWTQVRLKTEDYYIIVSAGVQLLLGYKRSSTFKHTGMVLQQSSPWSSPSIPVLGAFLYIKESSDQTYKLTFCPHFWEFHNGIKLLPMQFISSFKTLPSESHLAGSQAFTQPCNKVLKLISALGISPYKKDWAYSFVSAVNPLQKSFPFSCFVSWSVQYYM